MDITRAAKVATPDWIVDLVKQLKSQLSQSTQFVCKAAEDAATFGASERDEELVVQINNAESVKTTHFETDGQYKDGAAKNYRDGYVKSRVVQSWNYVIIENVVKDSEGKEKLVRTCYTRNKQLYLELRRSVGLAGY